MRGLWRWSWALWLSLVGLANGADPAPPQVLADLLAEAELVYRCPPGYRDVAPGQTSVLSYEHAVSSPGGELEVRVAVRPLKRLRIDYDDPHGAIPDPNHIFPLMFESLASRLGGGRHAPSNPYPPQEAQSRFNADWAAAAVFDVAAEFESPHAHGLLLAMHRNKVSDAYVVVLFDDYDTLRAHLDEVMQIVVFAPRTGDGEGTS